MTVDTIAAATRVLTVGVDPGLSGAIAFLEDDGQIAGVYDLPVVRDAKLAWIHGGQLSSMIIDHKAFRRCTAMVERVNSMPQQGIASAFQFGVGFGSVLSVLQALGVAIEFVRPTEWKKSYGLGGDNKAKHQALHKARLLYPDAELGLAKHDGRAEALLIARYAMNRRTK